MLHRIFLAINLAEPLKEEMLQVKDKLPEVPCKWTSKENLHFTLVFLGNTSDKELEEVISLAKKVGEQHKKFSIALTRIVYGPLKSPGRVLTPREDARLTRPHKQSSLLMPPRMIWAIGKAPKALVSLQKGLEKAFAASTILHFTPEKRPYSLHLTLARLDEVELQTMEQDELPVLDEEIEWKVPVESFEIMESHLKRGGAEYTICESISLA